MLIKIDKVAMYTAIISVSYNIQMLSLLEKIEAKQGEEPEGCCGILFG